MTSDRPQPGGLPEGVEWPFEDVVQASGYRNVVSTRTPPRILLHHGPNDERLDGGATFLIASSTLPDDREGCARMVLERMCDLGDWAAGEIVGRRHRDIERERSGYASQAPRLSKREFLVRRFVRLNEVSTRDEIAHGVGMDEIAVDETTSVLCARGVLVRIGNSFRLSEAEIFHIAAAHAILDRTHDVPSDPDDAFGAPLSDIGAPR